MPLVPRPAVLPLEPSPRPTRVLAVRAPGAGRRWWTLRVVPWAVEVFSAWSAFSSDMVTPLSVDFFNGDEVRHGADHAPDLRAVLLDDDVTDALETEAAQRLAMVALAADLGSGLG